MTFACGFSLFVVSCRRCTIKRKLTLALALLLTLSLIGIPAQAKKAGEIKNDVYTDLEYNFSFNTPAGWSAKIGNTGKVLRIGLDQTSAVPPRHFQGDLRDYMQIPTIRVLVDTTSLSVDAFIDKLLDPNFKSKQKTGLMKYLTLLGKNPEIQKRSNITFADIKATTLEARQAYSMEVSTRGSDRADVVNDYKYGSIFFSVRDGRIYIFHMICEYQTSGPLINIFNSLIASLKFDGAAGAATEESSD